MEDFKKIYTETIKHWPKKIDISDGKLTENGGTYFKTLSNKWSIIEEKTDIDFSNLFGGEDEDY